MNTSFVSLTRASLCTCFALALIAAAPVKSFAQDKGATKQLELSNTAISKFINTSTDLEGLDTGDQMVMSCPKCKDVMVTTVSKPQKGAYKETKTFTQHLCPGCKTTIEFVGHGKNKTRKVTHTCSMCGSTDAFCCVVKKGASPTKGMEN